jgi:hypothetical protein
MGQRSRISISEILYVLASITMSGNRLVSIIANDCTPMLTKPCPQRSSSFSNIKHVMKWEEVHVNLYVEAVYVNVIYHSYLEIFVS